MLRWTLPPAPGSPGVPGSARPGRGRPPNLAARGRAPGAAAAGVTAATGSSLDPLLDAVVEATEEAVLTSMLAAPIVVGRDGNTSPGLPAARVRALLATAGRC